MTKLETLKEALAGCGAVLFCASASKVSDELDGEGGEGREEGGVNHRVMLELSCVSVVRGSVDPRIPAMMGGMESGGLDRWGRKRATS